MLTRPGVTRQPPASIRRTVAPAATAALRRGSWSHGGDPVPGDDDVAACVLGPVRVHRHDRAAVQNQRPARPLRRAHCAPPQAAGGQPDGIHDLLVAGAPAQVAGQGLADLQVVRLRHPAQQVVRGDDQARRAEAALDGAGLHERLLDRVQPGRLGQALDGDDVAALRLPRRHQAGADHLRRPGRSCRTRTRPARTRSWSRAGRVARAARTAGSRRARRRRRAPSRR